MTLAINDRVRLTVDAQERQPDIGHTTGMVVDTGGGAVKVRWGQSEAWHKVDDLALATGATQ